MSDTSSEFLRQIQDDLDAAHRAAWSLKAEAQSLVFDLDLIHDNVDGEHVGDEFLDAFDQACSSARAAAEEADTAERDLRGLQVVEPEFNAEPGEPETATSTTV